MKPIQLLVFVFSTVAMNAGDLSPKQIHEIGNFKRQISSCADQSDMTWKAWPLKSNPAQPTNVTAEAKAAFQKAAALNRKLILLDDWSDSIPSKVSQVMLECWQGLRNCSDARCAIYFQLQDVPSEPGSSKFSMQLKKANDGMKQCRENLARLERLITAK